MTILSRAVRVDDSPLMELVEFYRLDAACQGDAESKGALGQFLTPAPIASFMASLFDDLPPSLPIHILDAGAGVGSLTAAVIDRFSHLATPSAMEATLYELDKQVLPCLERTVAACLEHCHRAGVSLEVEIIDQDFIVDATDALGGSMFATGRAASYSHAILNPPYKKLKSKSTHKSHLSRVGIEATNLYSAFVSLAIHLLQPGGELVAIIPRSFCNGPYFRAFRDLFHAEMSLRRVHLFDSRTQSFQEDGVLQENIILHAVKGEAQGPVRLSASSDPTLGDMTAVERRFDQVVSPSDPHRFWHLSVNDLDQQVADHLRHFSTSLSELGIDVSTGPVVDFRLKEHLLDEPAQGAAPLIYPTHFEGYEVVWPKSGSRKANAIRQNECTTKWLWPVGTYTLVRRFSSKEEPRRLVAALCEPPSEAGPMIGFENHVNVFHKKKTGLDPTLAQGLVVYLSSTLVDSYFRLFNGHTQVNVTDLRSLPYPTLQELLDLGAALEGSGSLSQDDIDALVERFIQDMVDSPTSDPVQAQRKIEEAVQILQALGLPRAQQNERSALTLLALLDLRPDSDWAEAQAPLMGITPIMDFCREHYGRHYAPNTRETFRRQTMHQFIAAGLVVENPDRPDRPKNSPSWCYQIEPSALELLKLFGTGAWQQRLTQYQAEVETLQERYARVRQMQMVPVTLSTGEQVELSAGQHSELIKAIVEEFAPRFAPGGEVLYLGDTGAKRSFYDEAGFEVLGITLHKRGKMPDVVIYFREKNWLLLIEAVTSHGPVDSKRHEELTDLLAGSSAGLIYVTAFPSRSVMRDYLADISWETEVWVAAAPSHLIHFDGERFLGPY